MNYIEYPVPETWAELIKRPEANAADLEALVEPIMRDVQREGDRAVERYSLLFDNVVPENILVTREEIEQAKATFDPLLLEAMLVAKKNITTFHQAQQQPTLDVETMPGVRCYRKNIAIEKVGLYIPGGTAPLFSTVLMLAIPAQLAGCKEIILCSPPNAQGQLHPAILIAADLCGVTKIYKTGGVQAIAAMAYGTATIPQVQKIFGPGNQYVTCAKRLLAKNGFAIDMPAGPSEVAVLVDETAIPEFVAADLLAQAEHGADSQVFLVSTSSDMAKQIMTETLKQLEALPRKAFAQAALEHSNVVVMKNFTEAMQVLNAYAPEHLILCCADAEARAEEVINAGSVFIGHWSPESVGDYASGTNHTLPTNGAAVAWSGVSLDSFVKKITFQQLTQTGLQNIGTYVERMAEAEGLQAHRNAVSVRLKKH